MSVARHVTTITLGRRSPGRLDATYPHTPGAPSTCAYLVLLRVEIARFTRWAAPIGWLCAPGCTGGWLAPASTHRTPKKRCPSTRLCCSDPHLGVLRPFGGQPLAATLPCAVRTFLQCCVSTMAPAVVWWASHADYRGASQGIISARNGQANWPKMSAPPLQPFTTRFTTQESPCP